VHVAHDCQVGADVEIGASAVLCGHVTVGDGARISGLAFVRPFITIGAGARIGGGAVVVKDVPPGEVWAGVPARPLKKAQDSETVDLSQDWERYGEACEEARARAAL
jgi:UDP-3-O-[3-hydroxymyristoyl] glucosamine N-acyltransferase